MEFQNNVTHVYLMGGHSTAILTPFHSQNVPVTRLVVAHEQYQHADFSQLKQSLSNQDIEIESWILPTTTSSDEVLQSFFELFNYEKNGEQDVLFNATGGPRHKVIAAYEAARSYDLPIYIVEPEQDSLFWLYPDYYPKIKLASNIKYFEFGKFRAVV